MSSATLAHRLTTVLRPILGSDVAVTDLSVVTGGASRDTWAFDAVIGGHRRPLILRTGPANAPASDLSFQQHASMELEAAVQHRAALAGTPVPTIITADDSLAALGKPYLICEAIAGETIVRRIRRQLDKADEGAYDRLLRQCAEALAAIHRADTTGIALQQSDPLIELRARLDGVGETTAAFEWSMRWLAANRPPPSPPVLVHGDFRMGNLIIDGGALSAVLDWELVHVGEAYEDVAWFCIRAWRFGAPEHLGAGGLGEIETFLSAYEASSGTKLDRASFRWWLVLATLRWGAICRYQAERHLSGQTRSVELAAIGRRVCETEWDLLTLLDEDGAR